MSKTFARHVKAAKTCYTLRIVTAQGGMQVKVRTQKALRALWRATRGVRQHDAYDS